MTLSTTTNKVQYTCDGSTDTYPYTFKIIQSADLYVIWTDSNEEDHTWTENTEYTVTSVGEESGGNVVVDALYVPASGTTLTIYREVPLTQESDYVENDPFHADTLETDLDRTIMIMQQLDENIGRGFQLSITDGSNPDMTIPNLGDRISTYLGFDENGDLTVYDNIADAIGPGSDNHVARYDGTDAIQTSLATIDDSGNIYTPGNIVGTNISASYISSADAAFDYLTTSSGEVNGVLTVSGIAIGENLTIDVDGNITTYGTITALGLDLSGAVVAAEFYEIDTTLLSVDTMTYKTYEILSGYDSSGLVRLDYAGEQMSFGSLCYKAADGKFYKSINTDASTLPAVAMCAQNVDDDGEQYNFLLHGYARWDSWSWSTVGASLYVSTTGGIYNIPTDTLPSGSGDHVQIIGWVISADTIFFNPDYTIVEVA